MHWADSPYGYFASQRQDQRTIPRDHSLQLNLYLAHESRPRVVHLEAYPVTQARDVMDTSSTSTPIKYIEKLPQARWDQTWW
jgi:hypothetical protein